MALRRRTVLEMFSWFDKPMWAFQMFIVNSLVVATRRYAPVHVTRCYLPQLRGQYLFGLTSLVLTPTCSACCTPSRICYTCIKILAMG